MNLYPTFGTFLIIIYFLAIFKNIMHEEKIVLS